MKKIIFILILLCSSCAVTEKTNKCETETNKKECCSKK